MLKLFQYGSNDGHIRPNVPRRYTYSPFITKTIPAMYYYAILQVSE